MSRSKPVDLLLAPAAALYGLVVRTRVALYGHGLVRQRKLEGRVLSVGNLTVGGTAKTPTVIALAKLLRAPGRRLGVLTRGYRRRVSELVVLKGAEEFRGDWPSAVARAGDEPVLLARHLADVPIGVAADRYAAGRLLEREQGVNFFLLDDGFQHLRLARDLDLVLLDATASEEALLPRGRLREPWSALRRAPIVLITRVEQADPTPWIRRIRSANPTAGIFCAKIQLDSVRDAITDQALSKESWQNQPGFAYCGIGNAGAFLRNLGEWGFQVSGSRIFPDHHRYTSSELGELARAAEAAHCDFLVTTEKDVLNGPGLAQMPLPIYYCRIALEFDQPQALLAEIDRGLEAAK